MLRRTVPLQKYLNTQLSVLHCQLFLGMLKCLFTKGKFYLRNAYLRKSINMSNMSILTSV